MSKILFITNTANKIGSFSTASIQAAQKTGIEFNMVACWSCSKEEMNKLEKEFGVKLHHVELDRSPYSFKNYSAFKQIEKIICEEGIDYIHCNTPVGGILGRLAGKKCKVKKVIYQAHGFHFYKGAPIKNWLMYYPVEKLLARFTDAIITINKEDYELAKSKLKLRNGGKVYYVPGVGIDTSQYSTNTTLRKDKRIEMGLQESDIALISMGDLIERKNYDTAIRAIAEAHNKNLQYYICGKGPEEENLKKLAQKLGIAKQIHFLGFRSDVKELLAASDIFLFTTKQEGLPRSMMEAMASGLPCIASKIRGNSDLLENSGGGFLCDATDACLFAQKINLVAGDDIVRKEMGKNNLINIRKFNTETVNEEMFKVYFAELQ